MDSDEPTPHREAYLCPCSRSSPSHPLAGSHENFDHRNCPENPTLWAPSAGMSVRLVWYERVKRVKDMTRLVCRMRGTQIARGL